MRVRVRLRVRVIVRVGEGLGLVLGLVHLHDERDERAEIWRDMEEIWGDIGGI